MSKSFNVLPYKGENIEYDQREYQILHMPYSIEKKGLDLIRNGQHKEFHEYASRTFESGPWIGKLSGSDLQQAKYIAVICIALGIRAGIDGGLQEEEAMNLSDAFIQKIDQRNDAYSIYRAMISFMTNIAFLVNKKKTEQRYSYPVKMAIEYIYVHLHERITVKAIAEYSGVTPSYLSTAFSKETGEPLSAYIAGRKLEYAKDLIATRQAPLKNLGVFLGFCSQSYFIKCFKTKYGMTPKQFRDSINYQ